MHRLLIALAFASIAVSSQAEPVRAFNTTAFKAAQREGRPILVDVHADWCPTCRAQAPTIAALSGDPAFRRLVIFQLDYDRQLDEKRALGVSQQSTLITFIGGREVSRVVGITDPAQIRAFAAGAMR